MTSFIIVLGLLRKKLNFDFVDNFDLDYHEDNEDEEDDEAMILPRVQPPKRRRFCPNTSGASGDAGLDATCGSGSSLQNTPNSNPSTTRSGRVYNAASSSEKPIRTTKLKSSSACSKKSSSSSRLPTPLFSQPQRPKELNLLQRNLDSQPPPLNYSKRPVSR